MMMSIRAGLMAAVAGTAVMVMAGCTSGQLAAATGAVTGGTNGAVSTGGTACANNSNGAAAAPTTASSSQGNYVGKTIPNGWDTAYTSQSALDGGFTNLKNTNPTAWETAKCIYQPAIAVWSSNTGNTP